MGHRLTAFALALTPLAAGAAGDVSEVERDLIRERAQMEIMREPADTEIEPDLALIRSIFARPIEVGGEWDMNEQVALPMVQIASTEEGFTAGDALQLITSAIKYRLHNAGADLSQRIYLPRTSKARLDMYLYAVEQQSDLRFAVFPESQTLVVRRK